MLYLVLILIRHRDRMVLVRVFLRTTCKSLRRIFLTAFLNSLLMEKSLKRLIIPLLLLFQKYIALRKLVITNPLVYTLQFIKLLVNRLQPLLDRLISPFQSAFVPGRSIHDNILLTHEIMHKFKNLKTETA